jgi:hypothetical protein
VSKTLVDQGVVKMVAEHSRRGTEDDVELQGPRDRGDRKAAALQLQLRVPGTQPDGQSLYDRIRSAADFRRDLSLAK